MKPNKNITPNRLRHSRITHNVEEGWDYLDLHENARHEKYEETDNYMHHSPEARRMRIEKHLNLNKAPVINGVVLFEENTTKFIIYKTLEAIEPQITPVQNNFNKIALTKKFYLDILNSVYKTTNPAQYYTLEDLESKLGLKHSQAWQRVKLLEKAGYIHTVKNSSGEITIPKWEFDEFDNKFIELSEAVKIPKITSRGKINYIRKLAKTGKIAGIPIGRLHFLNRVAFNNWLKSKKEKNAKIT
ncbi:MAG: hypothetical protein WC947_08195 [Elusimicrobiota bacterium]